MIGRYLEGGWEAVTAAFESPPPSTEQILHPEKRGADMPLAVTLPECKHASAHEDVVGELQISILLNLLGCDKATAYLASAGWDGDRLGVYAAEGGAKVVVWRTVWDRDEDARQFVGVLRERAGGQAVGRGRVVDWFGGPSESIEKEVASALENHPSDYPEDRADMESTRLVEAAWRDGQALEPRASEKSWEHPKAGLKIAIPAGWAVKEIQGVPFLMDLSGAEPGFASNVSVQMSALPPGQQDLDAVKKLYLTWLRVEQLHNPSVDPERYYEEALRKDPSDVRSNTMLAIRVQGAAQPGTSEWPETRFYQALCLVELGEKDKSGRIFDELIATASGRLSQAVRADFFAKFGEQASERAGAASAHYLLGLASLGKGDREQAREELEEAVSLNVSHVWARHWRSQLE
ncbi:MAG: hypothetical protein AB1486_04130 [Planctomycetota bacterium]